MINRRNLVIGLGSGVLGASIKGPSFAQTLQNIRVTHAVTSLAYVQSYVAKQNGYFADAGLAAQLVDTGGGGPDVQLVLGGRAEMTVNDGAQVLPALQQGQKLTCVLSLLNRSIVNATMRTETAQRLGIVESTSFKEKISKLKGLKIGVTKAGALTWQLARFNLVSAGLDPEKDAQVVAIGGPPALAAALENGAVDLIYISMPVGERLVREGKAITFVNNAKGEDPKLKNFMMEGLWATPDYIASNREIVSAAVKAYAKASAFIVSSTPEEVARVLMPVLGSLGESVLIDAMSSIQPAISRTGYIDEKELNATQDVLSMNGFLNKKFTLDDVFNPGFVGS
jgi:NitT/TauT family transport system substrate-binding protein